MTRDDKGLGRTSKYSAFLDPVNRRKVSKNAF
jgi:hypothetical protein